jgi:hypothetical protein
VALPVLAQLACTNTAVDKAVGTANGASSIAVARGERGVTVENRAGRPLLNIRLEVQVRDNGAPFLYVLPTLDAGGSREIPYADFHTEDGTLLDAGSVAATEIKTTARDTLANSYNVAVPWDSSGQ